MEENIMHFKCLIFLLCVQEKKKSYVTITGAKTRLGENRRKEIKERLESGTTGTEPIILRVRNNNKHF